MKVNNYDESITPITLDLKGNDARRLEVLAALFGTSTHDYIIHSIRADFVDIAGDMLEALAEELTEE